MNRIRSLLGLAIVLSSFPIYAQAAPRHRTAAPASRPVGIPATGTLTHGNLMGIAAIALVKPKDEFSADPTDKFEGRRFKIMQPIDSSESEDRRFDGVWSYDKINQDMTFTFQPAEDGHIRLYYKNTFVRSFVGQTAMGVKFRVKQSNGLDIYLLSSDISDLKSFHISATPEQGRKLANSVDLEIEGVLTKDREGVASCSIEDMNASLDDPTEELRTTCLINATIDRVAFVNTSTGAVLKEFPASKAGLP